MMSWGYLIDRATRLNLNLTNQLSRTPSKCLRFAKYLVAFLVYTDQDGIKPGGFRAGSGTGMRHKSPPPRVHVPGRIVFSVWRQLRKELALTSYTFESTFFQVALSTNNTNIELPWLLLLQVMHQRIPMFSFQTLTHWYEMGTHANRFDILHENLNSFCNCTWM